MSSAAAAARLARGASDSLDIRTAWRDHEAADDDRRHGAHEEAEMAFQLCADRIAEMIQRRRDHEERAPRVMIARRMNKGKL